MPHVPVEGLHIPGIPSIFNLDHRVMETKKKQMAANFTVMSVLFIFAHFLNVWCLFAEVES